MVYIEIDTGLTYNQTTVTEHIVISGVKPFSIYGIRVSAFTVSLGPFSFETTVNTPEDGKLMLVSSINK